MVSLSPSSELGFVQVGFVVNYIGVVTLSFTVWDHLLTFSDEVRFIWKAKRFGFTEGLYLLNRYSTEAGLLFLIWYQHWLRASPEICRKFFLVIATWIIASIATENVTIAFRVYTLWERSKKTMVVLWVALGIVYAAVVACFIPAARKIQGLPAPGQVCIILDDSGLIAGIWGALLAFDLLIFTMFILGALAEPWRRGSDVYDRLKRAGIIVYAFLSAMRLMNLILTVSLPTDAIFTPSAIHWGLGSVILSRLILSIEQTKLRAQLGGNTDMLNLYELSERSTTMYGL